MEIDSLGMNETSVLGTAAIEIFAFIGDEFLRGSAWRKDKRFLFLHNRLIAGFDGHFAVGF